MAENMPTAIELPESPPIEFDRIHKGQNGLSRHYDPVTTKHLAEAIKSLGPVKQDQIFEKAATELRNISNKINEEAKNSRVRDSNWFCIIGFKLNEDKIVAVKDEPNGELLPQIEYGPGDLETKGLIRDIEIAQMWVPEPYASVTFEANPEFRNYNYHYVTSHEHFKERRLDPLEITSVELAIFLSQEIDRKLTLMHEMHQFNRQAENVYKAIFTEPLTKSLLIHQAIHGKKN